MKALYWLALTPIAIVGGLISSTPASAQATRTWVSGVGDDANPCSRTAPCKTFAGAISKTAAGGEITCLDPAGFGTVTIVKAISINCVGPSNGGILSSSTTGIIVNAGATDDVVLMGVDINGAANGITGIRFLNGGTLTVQHSTLRNFTTNGIEFAPTGNSKLFVTESTITDAGSGGGTGAGIQIRPTGSGTAIVTIDRAAVTNSRYGIIADGSATTGKINGMLRDSNISGHNQNGVTTSIGTASNVTLTIDNIAVVGNGNNGLAASGANAGMLVGNSTIYGNAGGVFTAAGSAIVSYGNNRLNGNNGNDGAFTSTIAQR